jgi:hypothetical protein
MTANILGKVFLVAQDLVLAGGSCSGFRPTGVLECATGLPVGLHSVDPLCLNFGQKLIGQCS